MSDSRIKGARTMSGITIAEAAKAANMSVDTYRKYEQSPGLFSLEQIKGLSSILNNESKKIVHEVISFFINEYYF